MSRESTHPNSNLTDMPGGSGLLSTELSDVMMNKNKPVIHKDYCVPDTYLTIQANKQAYNASELVRLDFPNNNIRGNKSFFEIDFALGGTVGAQTYLRSIEDIIGEISFYANDVRIFTTSEAGLCIAANKKLRNEERIKGNRRGDGYEMGALAVGGSVTGYPANAVPGSQFPFNPIMTTSSCYGLLPQKDATDGANPQSDVQTQLATLIGTNKVTYTWNFTDEVFSMLNEEFLPFLETNVKFYVTFQLNSVAKSIQNPDPATTYQASFRYRCLVANVSDALRDTLKAQMIAGDANPAADAWVISSINRSVLTHSLSAITSFVDLTVSTINKLRSVIFILQRTGTQVLPIHNVWYDALNTARLGNSDGIIWQVTSSIGDQYPQIPVALNKKDYQTCLRFLEQIWNEKDHSLVATPYNVYPTETTLGSPDQNSIVFTIPDYVQKSCMFGYSFRNYESDSKNHSCGFDMSKDKLQLRLDSTGAINLANYQLYVIYEYENLYLLSQNNFRTQ